MAANVELPYGIMVRIEAEAKRCQLSAADIIARLTGYLPVRKDDEEMAIPAFVGAGASATGITHRVDELLADGFGRS